MCKMEVRCPIRLGNLGNVESPATNYGSAKMILVHIQGLQSFLGGM